MNMLELKLKVKCQCCEFWYLQVRVCFSKDFFFFFFVSTMIQRAVYIG